MVTSTRPVIDIDFDGIKADIIDFIKSNPAFTDYNFEGSALNAIADILAYNTFNNAYYANMLHAEGFLDSAQKRSSVVSIAKQLGYTPRSAVCATAYVSMVVNTSTPVYPPYSLNRGNVFYASNDSSSYAFYVADTYVASISGNTHTFNSIKLVNGTRIKNTLVADSLANPRMMFKIPNAGIDISTLKVYVKDTISSVDKTEYFKVDDVYSLLPTSLVYFVQESHDGFFEIYFGGNVLGKQPVSGNAIELDYFVCSNFDAANGCKTFTFDGSFPSSTGSTATTLSNSFGGAQKEGLESIKNNAVLATMSKNRIVTASDYTLEMFKKFPFIKSVCVWGGEDNVPPVYGKVFISAQTVDGYELSDSTKRNVIIPEIRKTSMMTITPEIVDPSYTLIEFSSIVKYDVTRTINGAEAVAAIVQSTISNYMDKISVFGGDYLESSLIGSIIDSDPGVVSVDIAKKIGIDISPVLDTTTKFTGILNNRIVPGSIESNKFSVTLSNGTFTVTIKETGTDKLGLFDYYTGSLLQEIGTINTLTGDFEISLSVSSYLTDDLVISIRAIPYYDDLIVRRNQILAINKTKTSSNIVTIENYGK